MLVDYRQCIFFQLLLVLAQADQYRKSIHSKIQRQDRETHFSAADADNNCHVIRMTDNSKLCCARFKSRASAVNKGL